MKIKRSRKAFTIVELVIVIAVIAILATVLVPTFGEMINKAKDSKAMQEAKNAYTSYMVENAAKGEMPELFLYKAEEGRVVALLNGAAVGVYESEYAALTALGLEEDAKLTNTGDGKLFAYGGEVPRPDEPDVEPEEFVDWVGKTILFLGDSIPHGQTMTGTITTPYPRIVAENLGMKLKNYAIGGSTIAYKENYGGAFATYEEFLAAEKNPNLYYQVINGQNYTSYKCAGSDAWTEKLAINSQTGETTEQSNRTSSPMYENHGAITITLPDGVEMYIAAYDSNKTFIKDKFTGGYLSERTKTVTKEEAAYIRIMVRTTPDEQYVPAETAAQIAVVDENGNKVNAVQNWVKTDDVLRTPLTARLDLMTDDADVIVVHCGTNDFQYDWTAVGTPNDRTNHTFYGALNNLILGLQDKYSGKPIIFMTPLQRKQGSYTTAESKNAYGYTLNDYRGIIQDTCASYSIPVIDTYEIGPSPYHPEQASWFDSVGTHPDQQGHNMLGKLVAQELRNIYNVKDYRDEWENRYLAPLEFGSMTVQGGLLGTDNDLFYKRARSSVAVTVEEDVSITFTANPAVRFRLCVYNSDGTMKVFHDWTTTTKTYTISAGESFRLFYSASNADKVLTDEDLIAFAQTISIELK